MQVTEAIRSRYSVRAFLDRPVDLDRLREILTVAARAPSGGNLQPWQIHLVAGESMSRFKRLMEQRLVDTPEGEGGEYPVYPAEMIPSYRQRAFAVGEALYAAIGIAREDKPARRGQFARNFAFFGAPVGMFCLVDRSAGLPQWADLGMYLQSVMLLLTEAGLGSCAQESWARYHRSVTDFLGTPQDQMLFCGLAIGYPDGGAAINGWRAERADPAEFLVTHI